MIGKALTKALMEKGNEVVILTRDNARLSSVPGLSYANWDPANQLIDTNAFAKADHIIHLAGAGVADKRWTKKRKQEIVQSRVEGGELIVHSLKTIPNKIKTVISASAIGWYGKDDPLAGKEFTETDPPADDFLAATCYKWEQIIRPVEETGKRLVIFRIGIVLGKDGGVWKEFVKPLKWRFATILGSGKQMMSWIHIDDIVGMLMLALEKETMKGVYNAVGPAPVSNKQLVLAMARSRKKRFIIFKVPAFVLRVLLGEMSIEVLKSATVSARKIIGEGFCFQHTDITNAVLSITNQASPPAPASL